MPMVTAESKRRNRVKRVSNGMYEYIRELMRESKVTQKQLADLLGYQTAAAVSKKLEKMDFTTGQMILIMDYLGADPEEMKGIFRRYIHDERET